MSTTLTDAYIVQLTHRAFGCTSIEISAASDHAAKMRATRERNRCGKGWTVTLLWVDPAAQRTQHIGWRDDRSGWR